MLKNAFIKKSLHGYCYSDFGRRKTSKSRQRTNTIGQKIIRSNQKKDLCERIESCEKEK